LWIANRRKDRDNRIEDLSYGVRAVPEVMGRVEDIARLDFALVLSQADVAGEVVNAKSRAPVAHVYTSKLAHDLVLWAWSRRPDDIRFVDGCEDFILDAASAMSQQYTNEIPLVERSEQRIRLARLACAMAARLYSTDETAQQLLVRPEHVVLVVEFLRAAYDAPAMRYDRYSKVRRSAQAFTSEQLGSCLERLRRFEPESLPALTAYLNENDEIDKFGLAESTGWDMDTARQFTQIFTTKVRGLKPGGNRRMVKTPLLVTALKQLEVEL
jgi:hypothetical protein